jgi:cytochrome c oxidase assembly protein subunit 11
MFGFGFALIPAYGLLCELTGLGGRTGGAYVYDPAVVKIDETRLVKVNLLANTNDGMPWTFRAQTSGLRVHPGELTEAKFFVRNTTDRMMVAQAVPSLAPGSAAEYFHKTECFCFARQVLGPGEELEMPMRFFVAPELPRNVESLSLSYTLFDVTQLAADGLVDSGA